jgi:hypothetical protein
MVWVKTEIISQCSQFDAALPWPSFIARASSNSAHDSKGRMKCEVLHVKYLQVLPRLGYIIVVKDLQVLPHLGYTRC